MPGTKPEHRKIVIAASAFGNTNSALLMLVTAMCAQEHLPFYEALGATCSVNVKSTDNFPLASQQQSAACEDVYNVDLVINKVLPLADVHDNTM